MGADVEHIMAAMRAESIPEGWAGRWRVDKMAVETEFLSEHEGKPVMVQPGLYTFLRVLTDATLYHNPPGEVVMEDSPHELRTHLGFALRARGDVLVTGLGLGCVVRGLLSNPRVRSVTCIERSADVIKLVAPHMPADRLEIVHADALIWTERNVRKFDCAWHDLWTSRESGEPALDIWHAQMMINLYGKVKQQGAWSFDRSARRLFTRRGLRWIG